MDVINRRAEELLLSIKNSSVYQEYKKCEAVLDELPELRKRVDAFRANNFRLQSEVEHSHLFHTSEQLNKESVELRRIPEANAYLKAELALCSLMQQICRKLTDGIEMNIPYL